MTDSDKKILEEIISEMKKNEIFSEKDCEIWRAHCMENDEWLQIKEAWLRTKGK